MLKSLVFAVFLLFVASEAAHLKNLDRRRRDSPSTTCPKECKARPLELAFVVDGSASIWPQNFTLGLNFLEDFVDMFTISQDAVRASMVTYGDVVYTDDAFGFSAHNNNAELMDAISSMPYRSGVKTNTSGGIWYMLNHQIPEAREGVRRVAIVMTDGNSQERDLTKQAAKDAHDSGLEVFAIGIGHDLVTLEDEELHAIASDERHVFRTGSYDQLQSIMKRLTYEACDMEPMMACEMDPVDLSFVIDSSASIGAGNFTVGMHFVKDFVNAFLINPDSVRVSAITYGHGVYTQDGFGFTAYNNKKDLLDALVGIQWRHGDYTNTGEGIKYMRTEQMSYARQSAAHVAIVITDGKSQESEETKKEAKEAQQKGIVMYAVGVGKLGEQLDEEELNNIAGDSSRVLTADNYAKLNLLQGNLTHITCHGIMQSLEKKGMKFRQ